MEHIVVDGGSTDGTVEYLQGEPDVRWVSETDGGQSEAINKGFRSAKGSLLGWLNADDVLLPNAVSLIVEEFMDRPSSSWVMGNVVVTEGAIGRRERPAITGGPRRWATRNLAAQPGCFHPRWALDKVGLLDESLHFMMDMDLWLRLVDHQLPWSYVPQDLAIFEVHEESKSGGVSHSNFLCEEAFVRLRSGRVDQAAFALGRAVAWASAANNEPHERTFAHMSSSRPWLEDLPESDIRMGLEVETAILDLKNGNHRSILRLLRSRAWRHGLSRARFRDVVRREVRRFLRRDQADTRGLLAVLDDS